MERKDFLKRGLLGIGTIVALPTVITSCSKEDESNEMQNPSCAESPTETKGPFPIKTPTELVRENIIGDRNGLALLITLSIKDNSADCAPLENTYVDIWHCDADGNYSEYGGTQMQQTDYTSQHFLRGRQLTDANGQVSFISIFPGWYKGRAPHIHVEVLDEGLSSLKVTQIAFPKQICDTVYSTNGYNGAADTENESDNVFSDSLSLNMLDSIEGNTNDGYILNKTIVV